ncbi:MAG TPA: DciA family protein [Verrucomicrobiae bacterium]|nr:DciA family protein [Verrucomicrobiae bacterium]
MPFQKLGGIQSESLQKFAGLRRNVDAVRVIEAAKTVLNALWGEEKASLVRGVSFHDGELKLAATASIVVGELKLIETRLLNEINRHLAARVVQKLKIVQS